MPVDSGLTLFSGFRVVQVEPVGTRLNKGYRGVAGFEDQRELWNPAKVYRLPEPTFVYTSVLLSVGLAPARFFAGLGLLRVSLI
jgi:hypothetical protein